MSVALAALLEDTRLQLKPLVGVASAAAGIDWVSSSDLADPTPFLDAGQMVLTTGSQFEHAGEGPQLYETYVRRLLAAGVRALGFGTDVLRTGTPAALVEACEHQGLPLVEVPYHVPFIAVIRFVANAVASEAHAREAWAFGAQRAVSLAALGAEGVTDALRALSHHLGRAVVLFDASGDATATIAPGGLADTDFELIADEARRMLRRGSRSSGELTVESTLVTMQTFGRRGDLGGVLAVAGHRPLDVAETSVVTVAVALTEVSIVQGRAVRDGLAILRTQLMGLLVDGHVERASAIGDALGERLPTTPASVFFVARPGVSTESLVLRARSAGGVCADWAGGFVAILPNPGQDIADLWCEQLQIAGGLSALSDVTELSVAIDEAATASANSAVGRCHMARPTASIVDQLIGTTARRIANKRLGPLLSRADAADLFEAAAAWLRHNGQWDPAARELGIHRHTLKARVEQIAVLLALDLSVFGARVELWALLSAQSPTSLKR
jgi:purine catabolism regulator